MVGIVAKGTTLVAFGTVCYSVSQWLQLLILVRHTTVETVGEFALALAISAPAFMFANLRLRFLLASSTQGHRFFADYRTVRVAGALAAAVVVVAIGAAIQVSATVIGLMVAVKATEALSDVHQGLFQQREAFGFLALSQLAAAAVLLAGCYFGVTRYGTLEAALGGMLIGRLFVLVFLDGYLSHRLTPSAIVAPLFDPHRRQAIYALALQGLPLGLAALLISLNANIPRYFIEAYFGSRDLGVFAALVYIPAAGYLVVGVMGQVAMPSMARAVSSDDVRELRRILFRLGGLGLLLGIGGVLVAGTVGGPVLAFVYGETFADYELTFTMVMAAGAVSYIVVQIVYILTALRALKRQVIIYFSDAMILCALSFVLVPRLGLIGAGLAMIVSQLVQLLIASLLLAGEVGRRAEITGSGRS